MKLSDLPPALASQMEGYTPPDDFESDGCTVVWDVIIAVDTSPACHWHDWSYQLGGCKRKRLEADRAFYRNLRRCDLGKFLSSLRYLGVRWLGWTRFNWSGKGK